MTDDELFGEPYEGRNGVFGARLRVAGPGITFVVVPDVSAVTEAVRHGKFHLIPAAPVALPDRARVLAVRGLENRQLLLDTLTTAKGAIKVYYEVAED